MPIVRFPVVALAVLALIPAPLSAQIPTAASADLVLGQPNFETVEGAIGGTKATSLFDPLDVAVDPGTGKVFVSDGATHRVLRYSTKASLANGEPAEMVFGQPNFTSDAENADVSTSPTAPDATQVVGQSILTSPSGALAADRLKLDSRSQIFVDSDGDLWVADTDSGRVLRFSRPVVAAVPIPFPIVDSTTPKFRIRGRKTIETLRNRVLVRGTATDASGVRDIDVKVRGAKVAKARVKANGTFKVVLRFSKDRGRVVAKLRAIDAAGNRSKVDRFRIIRR